MNTGHPRQQHAETAAPAGLAPDLDVAAMAADNARGGGEAQAPAGELGGKERIEMRDIVCRSMPEPVSSTSRQT